MQPSKTNAICLKDLTTEEIQNYFIDVGLEDLWESIKKSEKITNFIRQPLFLSIMRVAHQQLDFEEWSNCKTEERAIAYLLGIYRVTMLSRLSSKKKTGSSR